MKASRLINVLQTLLNQPWAVFIWGAPGIGKSSIVKELANRNDMPIVDLRASLLDPTDLRGIPMIENGKAVWCPPTFLPRKDDKPGILFLDEINAAPPLVQAAMYQLILDRRIGEYELPDGWHIIAAGNRREDRAVTFRLSSALNNRFIHLTLEIDNNDWHDWALSAGVHPIVSAFLRTRPELLFQKTDEEGAFATPRSWHMASDVIYQFGSCDAASDVLPGVVGAGSAIELIGFAKNTMLLEEIEALIADPENAPVPERLDHLWALVSYLANRALEVKVQKAAGILLGRIPSDFAVVLARDILKVFPGFMRNANYLNFMKEHKQFFA